MASAALIFCLAAWLSAPASATDVYLSLSGQGADNRQSLALPPFLSEKAHSPEEALLARRLQEVVRADLLFSRFFSLMEKGTFFTGYNLPALTRDWKAAGAAWLLTAKTSLAGNSVILTVRLINLAAGEAAFERYYRHGAVHWRSLAHKVSDDIVETVTGKRGIASTRIAFSSPAAGHKEIHIVDYDGANLRQATRDRSIALLPRFSPDGKTIAYTSYKEGNPDLFLLDLEAGTSRALSREQGLNLAGGFSPDGKELLMTLSLQKDPNIFAKNLEGGALTRLTSHFGVDSSPTFSPDASLVAFVSDRSGNPQVYVLNVTTQKARRLTQNMNWCDSPAWSPTGEWIVFAGRLNRLDPINIFIVDVTGNQVRQLTRDTGSNENPTWSPDGRFIAFTSTRNGRPELFVMDADGSTPHRVAELPGAVFTPNWSR